MEFYKVIRDQVICRHSCIGFCKSPLLCYTKLYYLNMKLRKSNLKNIIRKNYTWLIGKLLSKKFFKTWWLFQTPWLHRRYKHIVVNNHFSFNKFKHKNLNFFKKNSNFKNIGSLVSLVKIDNILFNDFFYFNIIDTYKTLMWSYCDVHTEEDIEEISDEYEFLIDVSEEDIENKESVIPHIVNIRGDILYTFYDGFILFFEQFVILTLIVNSIKLCTNILTIFFNLFNALFTVIISSKNFFSAYNYNTYIQYQLYLKNCWRLYNPSLIKKTPAIFNLVTVELYQFIYLWCVQLFKTSFLLKIMVLDFNILFLNNLILQYLLSARIFLKKRLSRSKNTMLYNLPYILILTFYLKELSAIIFFLKTFFEQLHFSQHKRMLYIINFLVYYFSKTILKYYRCKGFYICFKGKLGVGGNARKRNYKIKLGDYSLNTLNKRLKYTTFSLWTITGTVGVKIILTY